MFGSNTQGRHGKGAALTARNKFGAEYGVGLGRTGQCYAIATKDGQMRRVSAKDVLIQVVRFFDYASRNRDLTFLVTEIGCGLAGFEVTEIAPMFANPPSNVLLPESFWRVLSPPVTPPTPLPRQSSTEARG